MEEARRLLDALQAELRAADDAAAAAGTPPDARVPLSPSPAVLQQASPPSSPPPRQQQQCQRQPQPEHAKAAVLEAPSKQQQQQEENKQKSAPQPAAEPIVGEEKSEWLPPAAPAPHDLPTPPGELRAEGSGHEILLQVPVMGMGRSFVQCILSTHKAASKIWLTSQFCPCIKHHAVATASKDLISHIPGVVLCQAFNWESCKAGDWWGQVEQAADSIARAGFRCQPCCAARQGLRSLYNHVACGVVTRPAAGTATETKVGKSIWLACLVAL